MKVVCTILPMKAGFITKDPRYVVGKVYDVGAVLYMNAPTMAILDDEGKRICALRSRVGEKCFIECSNTNLLAKKLGDL